MLAQTEMNPNKEGSFQASEFYQHNLVRPHPFETSQLLGNKNQVAGHSGFFSLLGEPKLCLKPFNINCVRGRREHLFYQLVEYYKRQQQQQQSSSGSVLQNAQTNHSTNQINHEIDNPYKNNNNINNNNHNILYYRDFPLLTYYDPPQASCDCAIDANLIQLLSSFVAKFYHVKHLSQGDITYQTGDGFHIRNSPAQLAFLESVYSGSTSCPCYGRDPKEKSACSRDYVKKDFLCLEDLTSHCRRPCIIDIKIGQITYDPMAIKEKVVEQSSKYKRLREFGFRILGMKQRDEVKDKTFGKTLETGDQVRQALESFFNPLENDRHKSLVIEKIIARLHDLLDWFENKNSNQLKFYSSSLLIVYDSFMIDGEELSNQEQDKLIGNSVRVSMIDFAHVLHVHRKQDAGDITNREGIDNNYIYGLRMLVRFFKNILKNYHHHLLPDPHHPQEPPRPLQV